MATILVVDDGSANRKFLVALLGSHGHRMLEAADGAEGLALARADHPDLVITDVLMPVMDGYELLRQLRLDSTTSGIPVVFSTAHYGEREACALALSNGAFAVLTKPAASADVLKVVGRALSGELQAGAESDLARSTASFDREHLRLLTDKVSEKAGDLRIANARLKALINIGLEIASEHDSDRLLQKVCEAAVDLFGASYVTLGILDSNGQTVRRCLTCGTDAAGCVPSANWITPGDAVPGILRTAVVDRRTVLGSNPDGDPAALKLPAGHPEIRAYLAAPITSEDHVHGWICLVGNDGHAFTEEEEHLLRALSGQVGRTYESGHLYAVAQTRAAALHREVLERTQAETALRSSETRYRRLFEAARDGILILDADTGEITAVNPFLADLLGYSEQDMLGKQVWDICPFEDTKTSRIAFRELQHKKYSRYDDLPLETRSGRLIAVEFVSNVYQAGSRNVIQCNIRDITERKRTERARQVSEGRYRTLFESAPDGIVIADAQSYYLDANPSICRMLGYAREELIGLHASDIVSSTETQYVEPALQAISATGAYQREWEFRRKDGSVFTADVIATSMPDGNLLAMIRDMTERNQALTAIRTAEERTRFALANADVGIWDMDYATGRLTWSETLEAQYGLAPGTFGGTFEAFVAHIHPDDRAGIIETVEKAAEAGTDFTVHHRSIRADGQVRWMSGVGRILIDTQGAPVRAVGISLDVTARHLLEVQMQQAQKMEAVGRLAGGIAHDFNNLLTAILGYCELLLGDFDEDDPRHADLMAIQKAGESAADLTRQLLAFSRKELIQPTPLDLSVVVADMRGILRRLIREDVKVVLALTTTPTCLMADRGQIEQIIVNLAVNARDAMPHGGTLTIETTTIDLDADFVETHPTMSVGPHVVLTVTDTGGGMTPDVQARLFEPFFTTKQIGQGTGLGLATVHGIAERSGGTIGVYSELGMGSTFKIYFPRVDSTDTPVSARRSAAQPDRGTHTVLVVEDAEGIRELTGRMLERLGYSVVMAANAHDALDVFERHPSIDMLLTDVVMPGGNGPELMARLSALRPGLKGIYMSGYTEESIVQHGVLNPGITFLHKPYTFEKLGRTIAEEFERTPSPPSSPASA